MQKNIKYLFVTFLLFLFPLFFLTTTQEFFITNKLYLLGFGALILLLISVGELLVSKKLVWQKNIFDGPVLLFLLTIGLSIIINSPNKIQALLNPNFGFLGLAALTVFYFYLSRINEPIKHFIYLCLSISSLILSLVTIIFYFQPLKSVSLSPSFQFLKNPSFNLIGNQLDLAIILGFFVLYAMVQLIKNEEVKSKISILTVTLLISNLLALALTVYTLLKPPVNPNQPSLILPPFTLSWYSAVETLKNPLTALFGVGVDNFASMFTRVKDIFYNQSNLWQINSFTISHSALLQIFTETGLFGIVAFAILIFGSLKKIFFEKKFTFEALGFGFVMIIMALFPPSLPLFFLFFFMLSLIAKDAHHGEKTFDMNDIIPFYLGFIVLSLVLIVGTGYLLGRSYVSEYYFKRSLNGIVNNNLKDLYDNERQAIIFNNFIERYRINFSQTNLLIANNIASKQTASVKERSGKTEAVNQLSDQDRQTITQAIQTAIAEAKAAVTLNPQKAGNWENLAAIYRNILNVAQGADTWTISAYQRAVILDPQNPIYRLNLGGVFYSLKNYDEAYNFFTQAVGLKSDWANAYYNLAWASYQKANYQQAVNAMQNAINLLDPAASKTDLEQAQKDLADFKSKLPATEQTQNASQSAATQKSQPSLSLPTPPAPVLSPKIELPKNASPEAK